MAGSKPKGLENAKYSKVVKFHPDHLCVIGIDTDDGPEHPDYDPRVELALDNEMVASIMSRGVDKVVDIAVVDGQPVVIDGRRRVLHAREALKRTKASERDKHPAAEVVCQVKRLSDVERARWAIVANNFRLADNEVTEAEKAERLRAMDVSDEDICRDFGWSIGTLRNRRKLLELPRSVLNMVRSGKLTVMAALKLRGMEPQEAQEAARELAESGTSKQAARAEARRQTASAEDSGDGPKAPSKATVRRVLQAIADEKVEEPEWSATDALQWAIGERSATAIKGLRKAIKDSAPKPRTKKAPPKPDELQ